MRWSGPRSITAFGQAQIGVETIKNNLRFPGQYYDAETGWHYNFQRYYDVESGRYTQIDPIGFAGRDLNWYAYVWANPINWGDAWGLEPLPLTEATIIEKEVEIAHYNKTEISTEFIMCMIWQESTFDPLKDVTKGGRGLMGIVRNGALGQVQETYHIAYTHEDMFDPLKNIEVGTLYLQWLIGWKGSIKEAVKFYRGSSEKVREAYYKKMKACEKCIKTTLSPTCDTSMSRATTYEQCFTTTLHK